MNVFMFFVTFEAQRLLEAIAPEMYKALTAIFCEAY